MANYLYSNRSKLKILAKTGLIVDFCTILQNPISVFGGYVKGLKNCYLVYNL